MLNASAGRESVGDFAEEYMRLDRIATQAKDPALFPEYGTNLQAAMVRDMRDTWASLAFDDQASFYDLFTTTKVVVNADLAPPLRHRCDRADLDDLPDQVVAGGRARAAAC